MKKNMVKETQSELKKVIWPTKKTVVNGTVVVAVMVILVGVLIVAFDLLSSTVIKKIIGDDMSNISYIESDNQEESDTTVEENAQNPVEENSEPTIDNTEVTE